MRRNCEKELVHGSFMLQRGGQLHIEVMLGIWEGMTMIDPMLAHMTR